RRDVPVVVDGGVERLSPRRRSAARHLLSAALAVAGDPSAPALRLALAGERGAGGGGHVRALPAARALAGGGGAGGDRDRALGVLRARAAPRDVRRLDGVADLAPVGDRALRAVAADRAPGRGQRVPRPGAARRRLVAAVLRRDRGRHLR